MARTKEVWNLNLNHASNVFVRNGKMAIMVSDPEDAGRQIFVNFNCDVDTFVTNFETKLEDFRSAKETEARNKKIASLRAILDGDFPTEMQDMAMNQLIHLENDGVIG